MNILSAPFYALFSLDFYRRVIQAPLRKGFLYLAYLSLIGTLVFFINLITVSVPQFDKFIDWMKGTMPQMVWTGDRLELSSTQGKYLMIHPELGALIGFDTSREEVPYEEIGNMPVFFTSTNVYVRQAANDLRIYSLQELFARGPEAGARIRIDGEFIDNFYQSWKPWALVSTLVFYFPFFVIWKLSAALFYSLLGLLVNLARREKLSYRTILNVSIFALTPVVLLQLLGFFIPFISRLMLGFIGALVVTWVYLFLAIKISEGPAKPLIDPFETS